MYADLYFKCCYSVKAEKKWMIQSSHFDHPVSDTEYFFLKLKTHLWHTFQNQINQIKLQNTDSKQEKTRESNDSSAPIKRYKKFSNLLLNSFTTRPTRNYSRTTVLTFKVIAVPTCAKFRLLPPFNILDIISSGFFAAMVHEVLEKNI